MSRSCGTAKGMRREGSGIGTRTRVSPRLTSLLFLLGEERYRQPRAVHKYWAGGYVPVALQRQVPAVLRVRFVSVHRQVLDILVMLQRQVSAVQLCRCALRIVLRLWTSLLFCSSSSCIPTRTLRCLSFRSSTECFNFSCASEACTRSANCAVAGDSTVQFFDVVYMPTAVR